MNIKNKLYSILGFEKLINTDYLKKVDNCSKIDMLNTLLELCSSNIQSAVYMILCSTVLLCSSFILKINATGTFINVASIISFIGAGVGMTAGTFNSLCESFKIRKLEELIKKEKVKENNEKNKLIDELAVKEVRMPKHDYSLYYSDGKSADVSFNELVNTLSVQELKVLKNKMDVLNDYYKYAKANREIFLRELISNASDALDKLYYKSLTDKSLKVRKNDLEILINISKDDRTITISDNGIGMDEKELENNLGTIAKSGSFDFKNENDKKKDINIIGQFGVGFYSAFMVSDEVSVLSKTSDSDAYLWKSSGSLGYNITKSEKDSRGTSITLHIKEGEEYDKYLEVSYIKNQIVKYSNYITYPIKIDNETINSMIPLWNKNKNKITSEEYNNFYMDKFNDYNEPLKVIHYNVEGLCSYRSILFIPSKVSYDYYTKEYKKGLSLYSNGVLIMDKCEELLPDYYSFVKGVVDSDDLSLNISRETLQNDKKVSQIAKSIESKIHKELINMLNEDRDKYIEFFKEFGTQIKYGIYNNFGLDKDKLEDLLLFYSSKEGKYVTLKEYVDNMIESQDKIYYACGESNDRIDNMPQVEQVKNKKYDILYLTNYVDEFAIKTLMKYEDKEFVNVCNSNVDLDSEEEKEEVNKYNLDNKDIIEAIKETLTDIKDARFTNKLNNNAVCLTTEGELSTEMAKVINRMPGSEKINADLVFEINKNHKIAGKLKELYNNDKDEFNKYIKVLYAEARLTSGLEVSNPNEISNIIADIMCK